MKNHIPFRERVLSYLTSKKRYEVSVLVTIHGVQFPADVQVEAYDKKGAYKRAEEVAITHIIKNEVRVLITGRKMLGRSKSFKESIIPTKQSM